DNDRYGTATPTDKEVQFSYIHRSTDDNGKYISTIRGGMLRLPAGLSVGRHYVYYKIRDIKDVTHSATATATVIVLPQTTTPTTSTATTTPTTTTSTTIILTAQDDTYTITYSTESQLVGSVYDNDHYDTATPTDKEVQFSYVRRSTDNNGKYISTIRGGMLRLPAGLSVGRHYVYYKIRDIKDITHFATATATVIVLPQTTTPTTETPTTSTSTTTPTTTTSTTITLTAQDDTYTVTYSTESQLVGSVYDNDRYGTATPTDKEVQFSYVRRSTDNNGKYISTVRGGMLRLPAALSVGHHYVYYKIRDIKDATHFATATATVIVLPQTTTPTTKTPTTEEPLRPIAVADAVTTPMNTPVLIAILQNDIPYDAVPYISAFPYKGSVTLNDSNEVLYIPNNNTTGADSFTYELRSPDTAISLATTTVTVKIWSPITPCTGISANGDGKNDYFHIMGIENYPENTLTIYDSNANEVFSVSHYDNEVCRFEGANLPQGVYFFVLTYRDEDDNLEQQVGWFYLKK
ncbi:gliding motility-associated C-terminal domain-containing protein, partial [Capnocytophaga bilenii]|uniref:T9SS type B sorting domain-containing protein n=1 Tax=Capnocytophaga bilenii TaxID=2819369 RepID=UPI0028D424D9